MCADAADPRLSCSCVGGLFCEDIIVLVCPAGQIRQRTGRVGGLLGSCRAFKALQPFPSSNSSTAAPLKTGKCPSAAQHGTYDRNLYFIND